EFRTRKGGKTMNQLIWVLLVLAAVLYLLSGVSRFFSFKSPDTILRSGGAGRWACWGLVSLFCSGSFCGPTRPADTARARIDARTTPVREFERQPFEAIAVKLKT